MKKLCAVFLTLVMLLGSVSLFAVCASADTTRLPDSAPWDGISAVKPSGSGTETDPYWIESASNFAWMAANPEELAVTDDATCMRLTANIDFGNRSFQPISLCMGDGEDSFKMHIVLDGQGATISGLNVSNVENGGLFAFVGARSLFKDVTLKDSSISATNAAAGFVATTDGGISFERCKTENVSVRAGQYGAGFLAYSDFTAEENRRWSVYDACVNEADVTVTADGKIGYAAGFFAFGKGASLIQFSFRYCANKGDMTVEKGASSSTLGGFLGRLCYDMERFDNYYFESFDCYNTGALVADLNENVRYYMGGFFGWAHIGGEIILHDIYDYSARTNSSFGINGGIIGNCSNYECIKILEECFAVNAKDSPSPYTAVYAATRNASTLKDNTSAVVETVNSVITANGKLSTLSAELARVDKAIAHIHEKNDEHLYENDCDKECDACREMRKPPHVYETDCDTVCNACGARRRESIAHTYDNACDAECKVCGSPRDEVESHVYDNTCDGECNVCGMPRATSHSFSGECDTRCDVCGATRIVKLPHQYSIGTESECDAECNRCGEIRDEGAVHAYDDDCDSKCNVCGWSRTTAHTYSSSCDNVCNVCHDIRTVEEEHRYASEEDDDCDACGFVRDLFAIEPQEKPDAEQLEISMPTIEGGALNIDSVGCGASVCAPWLLLCAAAVPVMMRKKKDD